MAPAKKGIDKEVVKIPEEEKKNYKVLRRFLVDSDQPLEVVSEQLKKLGLLERVEAEKRLFPYQYGKTVLAFTSKEDQKIYLKNHAGRPIVKEGQEKYDEE